MVQDKNVVTTDHHMNYVTACTVVQAVVKATIHTNRKDQILTPWGSETLEHISTKLKILTGSRVCPHMQIHVALRQRGWSGRTRKKTRVVVS